MKKENVEQLFNESGRRISKGVKADVCKANKEFSLNRPQLEFVEDFIKRIDNLHESLNINTGISGIKLKAHFIRLMTALKYKEQVSRITRTVCLPIVLPRMMSNDLGSELELYLRAVNYSYKQAFSDRVFNNGRYGKLSGQVSAVDESRHDLLIKKMKEGPLIGLFFPDALQGFSVEASREQMKTLPEGFILSGLDTVIAMIMYPKIIARDFNTLGLDLAALQYQTFKHSLDFGADNDRLNFDYTDGLDDAYEYYSSGLFFFG